eukprot:8722245-Karenia_brevis.AAC.1
MPPDVQQSFIDQRGGIPGEVEEESVPVPETPLRQSESVSDQNVVPSERPEPEEKESSDEETQVIQAEEHPRSSGQEMTKRQRE